MAKRSSTHDSHSVTTRRPTSPPPGQPDHPTTGLSLLITAGPTREYLDTIRYISNPSSGKMGYAIAAAAARCGHEVVLITGPVDLPAPPGVKVIRVMSAAQMAAAAKNHWPQQDAAIMTAAVCDYRPARQATRKKKKSTKPVQLTLLPTEDIARALGLSKQPGQVLVAFALEDHDGRAHAEAKLVRKNCDAIVLNDPGTISADQAKVEVLVRGGRWSRWRRSSKQQVAARLVRLVEGQVRCRGRLGEEEKQQQQPMQRRGR